MGMLIVVFTSLSDQALVLFETRITWITQTTGVFIAKSYNITKFAHMYSEVYLALDMYHSLLVRFPTY